MQNYHFSFSLSSFFFFFFFFRPSGERESLQKIEKAKMIIEEATVLFLKTRYILMNKHFTKNFYNLICDKYIDIFNSNLS